MSRSISLEALWVSVFACKAAKEQDIDTIGHLTEMLHPVGLRRLRD